VIRALVVALVLAGCGNPALHCFEGPDGGAYVPFNASCVPAARPIAIDGVFDDWAEVPSDHPGCDGCNPGDVVEVHAIVTPDDRLAIFGPTGGAPVVDATHSYLIDLTPFEQPIYATSIRVGGRPSETAFNGVLTSGLPFEIAFGSTGFELAIPRNALPFGPGVAIDLVELEVLQGSWRPAQNLVPQIMYICWDASSPLCKPL